MWIEIVTAFLGVSVFLYCLLGGADFGAGILELFSNKKQHDEQVEITTHALGPVWEANHMWLILAVVILFTGFPKAYGALSIAFHIPLTIALLGIIVRGCAFTYRHYDVVKGRSQFYYSVFFGISSLFTPLMLGVVAGASLLARLFPKNGPESSAFFDTFVAPWANLFSFSVGFFTCALFAFLAAVYLIGETEVPSLREAFIKRAKVVNAVAVVTGAFVFISAKQDNFPLLERFTAEPISLGAMALATLLLVPIWAGIGKQRTLIARLLAATQVGLILLGWFNLQFPILLATEQANIQWTIYNSAAPEATLRLLVYALFVGSALIFPALFYLMKTFKWNEK